LKNFEVFELEKNLKHFDLLIQIYSAQNQRLRKFTQRLNDRLAFLIYNKPIINNHKSLNVAYKAFNFSSLKGKNYILMMEKKRFEDIKVILQLKRAILDNDKHFFDEELNGWFRKDLYFTGIEELFYKKVETFKVNVKIGQKIDFLNAGGLIYK